ncbi:hypothetical protein ACFYSC_34140 [Streptosporangium sp. NPDC004379]|uniref:hypothetical protein n=1 Tax=Streptosporangium sp. NPDC004379 TaxID=3366189 RepID=UPI0036A38344
MNDSPPSPEPKPEPFPEPEREPASGPPPAPEPAPGPSREPDPAHRNRARRTLAALVIALFAALLLYRVLHAGHLEQTALFYLGLPAVIAVTVILTARPRTVTGLIMAAITVGLALAGPLLGEGIVCLVFAAPLFYFIGLIFGLVADGHRRRGTNAIAVPLVLLTLAAGGAELAAPSRDGEVTVSVQTSGRDVERALAAAPRFGAFDSPLLRLGFPRPVRSAGEGLRIGDRREIVFTPRRSLGIGAAPEPRSMTLGVKERAPGRVTFSVLGDTTLARWLDLREAEFAWGGGRVTVTLRYRRTFDPGWYFGPLQRYALGEAAAYLARTFG